VARRFRRRLLEWGEDHRRDLPWRHTSDPWSILVSEVMLQQTQAERVVDHYRRFLSRFPTVAACAAAPAAEVVRQWSGLGYNRRALNLHRAAQTVMSDFGGLIPEQDRALRSLPGIGSYTARAVRSFAFGADVATVDTNAVRVMARCVCGGPLSVGQAQELGDALVPRGGSWAFNQAMFDLGATVCRPTPECSKCPLRPMCSWRSEGQHGPDPWRASPSVRPQSRFDGSDRQGRGRLIDALRAGTVVRTDLAAACGWPDDPARAERIATALVAEGFAEWGGRPKVLRLR
jgi:A/G-specific adenine glycosylase